LEGTGTNLYYQDANHKHAVTHIGGTLPGNQKYWYDPNGNATRRISGTQDITLSYDAENRLTGMSGSVTASYVYDGDGQRVKATSGGTTAVYIGVYFEWTGSTATMKSYYYAGTTRVAMRTGPASGGVVYYLLSNHPSTSLRTGSRLDRHHIGQRRQPAQYQHGAALLSLRRGALHRRHDADQLQLHRPAQGDELGLAVLQRPLV